MPLQKQPLNINFSQGLDTKTDPWQVQPGKFLDLQNTIFDVNGQLKKRNGHKQFSNNTDNQSIATKFITTFKDNLIEIGGQVTAFDESNNEWNYKDYFEACGLNTKSIIRNSFNQTSVDTAIAPNGVGCTVYLESNGSTVTPKYTVYDSRTGNTIVLPVAIPDTYLYAIAPRVFCLNNTFIILYTTFNVTYDLRYLTISSANPTNISSGVVVAASYTYTSTLAYDGLVANNNFYVTYEKGGKVYITYFTSETINLLGGPVLPVAIATQAATIFCLYADPVTYYIWVAWYDGVSQNGSYAILDQYITIVTAAQSFISATAISNITMAIPTTASAIIYYELTNSDTTSLGKRYIDYKTLTSSGASSATTLIKSVGLASKAFIFNSSPYVLTTHDTFYQPGYFLVSHSNYADATLGNVIAKLAYQNGGGYLPYGLPNVIVNGTTATLPYRFKDLIATVNTSTNPSTGAQVYTQTGLNVVTFDFSTQVDAIEMANNLMIGSGFLWAYDGTCMHENSFFLYPENVTASPTTGGSMSAQQYYYRVTYEWTDNQGNILRSTPSIPLAVTVVGPNNAVTLTIPTLRISYKMDVKICVYRWSVGQTTYYQTTSITAPKLNDSTVDSITFTDTNADSSIIGNNVLYTTGGVLENINGPSTNIMTIFDSRLWFVDNEDKNLLWYSNQVLQTTPVEMSDLLTEYVQPTIGSNKGTGDITALGTMDDKILIFKRDAIYYINGTGPDATGANSQYSQPTFLTSTVGCANQRSIVFVPHGTIFQSDKGIWILKRDMSTDYIGAPVEKFNNFKVVSALAIAGTNQVRMGLDNGIVLMYDYYYNQWGTFTGISHDCATLYDNKYTYINSKNEIYQEEVGKYQDGKKPVLISFTTGWINLAGIQGFQRVYDIYLIGQYLSPNILNVMLSYDYAPFASQFTSIDPQNYSGVYGVMTYGTQSPYGGPGNLEQWRVFTQQQLCQAIRIQVSEQYNQKYTLAEGPGLTLSGLTLRIGLKKGTFPNPPSTSIG